MLKKKIAQIYNYRMCFLKTRTFILKVQVKVPASFNTFILKIEFTAEFSKVELQIYCFSLVLSNF